MMFSAPNDQPSMAMAEQGEVLVDGPNGVAITMSPDAAEETARRLVEAAREARSQREDGRD